MSEPNGAHLDGSLRLDGSLIRCPKRGCRVTATTSNKHAAAADVHYLKLVVASVFLRVNIFTCKFAATCLSNNST